LIESERAEEVQEIARRIEEQDVPDEYKGLALAELYAGYDLTAEAIEKLEALEQAEQIAPVYRLLGDLHRQIGLVLEAEVQYLEAVKLAEATENLDELAAANVGLGEVRYARGNREEGMSLLEEAKAIYEQLEDRERVSTLEERLAQLNR
jgi:tetratricopeptide (TPR) repeat protein